MKKVLETAMILMGTLGFWGFVYPEFCLTEETYKVESVEDREVSGRERGAEETEEDLDADGYGAENKIVVKSKLMEYLFFIKEAGDEAGKELY